MKLSKLQLAILAFILINIIWGAAFPIYKWSLENIEPFTFAFLRFFIASFIIFPFVMHKLKIKKEDYKTVLAIALTGVALEVPLWYLGLQLTASINAPIIGSLGPILLLVFATFFLREKLKFKTVVGTVLSLVGALFIVLRPALESGEGTSIIGNVFFLMATLSGVIYTLLMKKLAGKYNLFVLTYWAFLIGSLAIMPLALYETYMHGFLHEINIQGVTGLLYGIVFSSTIAYLLWAYGIRYLKANEAGVFSYIDPIIAAIVAMPLLGEAITPTYIIGAALVFFGIYIAEARLKYHHFHKMR